MPDAGGGGSANLGWGFAWPANRRIIYNRASARPDGTPWTERKKWVYWDPDKVNPATDKPGVWTGADVPDFAATKAPDAKPQPGRHRPRRAERHRPLHHEGGRQGLALRPDRLVDGPLPTHYEPVESPVRTPSTRRSRTPGAEGTGTSTTTRWPQPGDPRFPYVITTYRLTEHHLSGVMSRWLPWLAELQPELFVEISPELAGEKGIANPSWCG